MVKLASKGIDITVDHKKAYNDILKLDNHLNILSEIKKLYPVIYGELIKYGSKYTDRYVGDDINDLLSMVKK